MRRPLTGKLVIGWLRAGQLAEHHALHLAPWVTSGRAQVAQMVVSGSFWAVRSCIVVRLSAGGFLRLALRKRSRPEGQEPQVSDHAHEWKLPDGPMLVIDTFPEQYPYRCDCGAFTHDPATGQPCSICAPADYERRNVEHGHGRGRQ